jgi:hypothetical protein
MELAYGGLITALRINEWAVYCASCKQGAELMTGSQGWRKQISGLIIELAVGNKLMTCLLAGDEKMAPRCKIWTKRRPTLAVYKYQRWWSLPRAGRVRLRLRTLAWRQRPAGEGTPRKVFSSSLSPAWTTIAAGGSAVFYCFRSWSFSARTSGILKRWVLSIQSLTGTGRDLSSSSR